MGQHFNVFLSRLWTRSLESISCTVNVSSFIGTPTMVRPSAVTAVTVSYFSVTFAEVPILGQLPIRLADRLDQVGARSRGADASTVPAPAGRRGR